MFNNSMAWREAFAHTLKLPTSLQNMANMLDYQLSSAKPCEGTIKMYVPFPDESSSTFQFTLKNGTQCDCEVPYLIKDSYIITAGLNNYGVQKRDAVTGIISDIDTQVEIRNSVAFLTFDVSVWQIRIYQTTEKFTGVKYKEFYDVTISGFEDQFYDINVGCYIKDDNFAEPRLLKFNKVESIYMCGNKDKSYTFKYYGNGRGIIRFGNGVFGYQPKNDTNANILVYTTKGSDGIVYPGEVSLTTKLTDFYSGKTVDVFGMNMNTIDNGSSEENIEAAKANMIAQISSAKRLVTKGDYDSFEGITQIKNLELKPMLLRRDTNVNEIDIFSVIYDENGYPVPTNNLNCIIDKNRTLLSKDYVYKVAIITGENGIELAPNTFKYFNKSKIYDATNKEIIGAEYVNSEYDNFNEELGEEYNNKVYYLYSDGSKSDPIEPTEIKEFICPYNISIETKEGNKVGIFEYIPYELNNMPKINNQIDYIDVDITMTSAYFDYLPTTANISSDIRPTHINCINNLMISENTIPELITSFVRITNINTNNTETFDCTYKYVSEETGEMQTTCMIPINSIPNGPFKYEYIVYYSKKYYNTYVKYLTFKDYYDYSLVTDQIGITQLFTYNPSDENSIQQSAPAIDKVNISVTNVKVTWDTWEVEENDAIQTIEGYKVDVEINKLNQVDLNKVKIQFSVGNSNDTYDAESYSTNSEISANYIFKIPYNPQIILDGSTEYKVSIFYRFKDDEGNDSPDYVLFSDYIGYLIFRKRFSELMWANIEKVDVNNIDSNYKIYRIPVVEKSFYENNKTYFENEVFYQLALLDSNTIQYRMLSDRLNFKFAKTIGVTENLKYNDMVKNIDESLLYHNWTCELPPTIRVVILIDKNSDRTKQDIINDVKQVILTFLQLKADFNARIIRSELQRFIHDTVKDVISCEIIEPSKDIIYFYTEEDLPKDKDTVLSYTPEYLYIDYSKIKVDVKITPV